MSSVEKNKRSKKGASGTANPDKSSIKRPTGTSPVNYKLIKISFQELYCNSCQAVIREMLKKLKHRKSESDVSRGSL